MPTPVERIAVIEEQVRGIREDVTQLIAMIGDRREPESVRGRLHKLEGIIASAVMKRAVGATWLKGWERGALVLCALATVAASWYAALGH
jgi:hypothetical protein